MRSILLITTLFLFQGCISSEKKLYSKSMILGNIDNPVFAGAPKFLRAIRYNGTESGVVVSHPIYWHLYELEGYFLPKGYSQQKITVAHKSKSMLQTGFPWMVKLEPSYDLKLDGIKVSYVIKQVKLGESIYCPNKLEERLFELYKPVFKRVETNELCYRI